MSPLRYAMVPTPLGAWGLAWRGGVIVRGQLPEAAPERTRDRLLRGLEGAEEAEPEGVAAEAAAGVAALFTDGRPDLVHLPLDWEGVPELPRRVYVLTAAIPPGATRSYGELARELGDVSLSQAVGRALGRNPFAPLVPCHRVLGADGKLGGFSGGQGAATKLALLNLERAGGGGLFDDLPLAVR